MHLSLETPLVANVPTARRTAARSSSRCPAVSALLLSCSYRGHAGQNGALPHGTEKLLVLQHGTSSEGDAAAARLLEPFGSLSFHRPHTQQPFSGWLFSLPAAHLACFSTTPLTHSFCS